VTRPQRLNVTTPNRLALDSLVRARLREWPERPPGIKARTQDAWMRGRPHDPSCQCFLKLPGSVQLRTLPDGLWLNFGGKPSDPFVDIFAIEACASLQNLLDKRSRFSPSTHSLMAVCPLPWLLAPATAGSDTPRWRATGVIREEPSRALILPVRGLRVLFGLRSSHFDGFVKHQLPHPHEFFVPMDSLTAENGDQDRRLRALISRASTRGNVLERRKKVA
jgi:hypothetical protein